MIELETLLRKVQEGEISIEEASGWLRRQPFEDLGYAKIDTHRRIRSGFPEVIFCSGKADEHLLQIAGKLYEQEGEFLGTRASRHQYQLLKNY